MKAKFDNIGKGAGVIRPVIYFSYYIHINTFRIFYREVTAFILVDE